MIRDSGRSTCASTAAGPDLEHCPLQDGHARILWALPVTAAEVAYRREHGHKALEQLFNEHAINPHRPKASIRRLKVVGTVRAQAAAGESSSAVKGRGRHPIDGDRWDWLWQAFVKAAPMRDSRAVTEN